MIYSKLHLSLLLWSLLVASKDKRRILALLYCGRRDLMGPMILEWLMFILSANLVSIDGFWFWDFHSWLCLSASSVLQTRLSPWVWYSSWYLFSALHTHPSMNMCSAPFAGKKNSRPRCLQRSQVDINSWFTLVIISFCLSDVCLVWWKTVHRVSETAGIPLWVWKSCSDSDPESSKEKKRVR